MTEYYCCCCYYYYYSTISDPRLLSFRYCWGQFTDRTPMTDQRDALWSDNIVVGKKKYKPIRKEQLNEIRYSKLSKSANVNNAKLKRGVPKHGSRWQDQFHHFWTSEMPFVLEDYTEYRIRYSSQCSDCMSWKVRGSNVGSGKTFSVLKTSRPALRPTQVPGGKVTGREADHSLPPKLRVSGAIPPIPLYAFTWCKVKLYLITFFTQNLGSKG